MATKIIQVSDEEIHVNNKPVHKDMQGNWIASVELTTNEQQAFLNHVRSSNPEDVTKTESRSHG